MSEPELITCGTHGQTRATFACQHVAGGVACGFHDAGPGDDADPWPDAWCDLCAEALAADGGDWGEASSALADIKLLCTHCYEEARLRNQAVPPRVRGAAARLTADEVDALIHDAVHAAQAVQESSDARWHWRQLPRWDLDADAGTMTFSDPATGAAVVADARLVGSYSTKSTSFQWAWQTYAPGTPAVAVLARLRMFGEVRGVPALTEPRFDCDERTGWDLAALAGYVLGCEGLYRAPAGHLFWFMLLANWRPRA